MLSILTLHLDYIAIADDSIWLMGDWLYSGSSQGASAVLTTIASSMITIGGVVFSMTLVALTLASSQFGPRLLRNFMGDRVQQAALGTFVATFLYCLLVLRRIRHSDDELFVPHLSVSVAVLLATIAIGVLIHFIHHVASSIQADNIVSRIGRELNQAIDKLFPEDEEQGRDERAVGVADEGDLRLLVRSRRDGYLQYMNSTKLLSIASELGLRIRMKHGPGDFLLTGAVIAELFGSAVEDEDAVSERIINCLALGSQQASMQDVEFGIRQLVEVAMRALSPGVNEPFTAMQCMDRLGSALCQISQRKLERWRVYTDDEDLVRLSVPSLTFESLLGQSLDQLRQHLGGNSALHVHMLRTIGNVLEAGGKGMKAEALLHQAELVAESARRRISDEPDRQAVLDMLEDLQQRFAGKV